MKNKNVAIIGGGIVGLTTAYKLLQRGFNVTLYEKERYLGGLASSVKINGRYTIEKLYHHIFPTDYALIDLIKELGLYQNLHWYKGKMAVYYTGKLHAFSGSIDALRLPFLSILSKIRFGLVTLYLILKPTYRELQKISAEVWLKKYAGDKVYESIWKPLLHGKFRQYASNIPMAWLWARVKKRAGAKKKGGEEGFGYLEGGFSILITTLESRIREMGGEILTSTTVEKVTDARKVESSAGTRSYWKVVSTAPSVNVSYLNSLCLLVCTPQKLTSYYWMNVCDSSLPFSVVIQHTNLVPASRYGNQHVYYVGGYFAQDDLLYKQDQSTITEQFLTHLKDMFPQMDRNLITETHLHRFENAQKIISLSHLIPQQTDRLCDIIPADTPRPGILERTVNQAVITGENIAQELT